MRPVAAPAYDLLSEKQLRSCLRSRQLSQRMRELIRRELTRRGKPTKLRADDPPIVSLGLGQEGELQIRIHPEPPSANVLKRWLYSGRGGSRYRYARYRDRLAASFRDAARGQDLGPIFLPAVCAHEWRTIQRRDEDSFGWSLKPVLDALIQAGLLSDDKALTLRFDGQRSGGPRAHLERGLVLTFTPLLA